MTPSAPEPTGPAEVSGLASAQAYARDMTHAYATAASRAESFAGGLGGCGVSGPAVAAVGRAQELTMQAGAAWADASGALDRQGTVRDAYAAAPQSGSKDFVTDDSADDDPAGPVATKTSLPEAAVSDQPTVRIKTSDTEQSDVVVTPGPGAVRIELAADPWEPADGTGPVVLLDETGTAALAAAGIAMDAAEKAARAERRKLDTRIGRLEQRRDQINNRPYETEEYAALGREFDELWPRFDALFGQMRRRMPALDAESQAAFGTLEDQVKDGDRPTIRAAQRQILHEAGVGQDDPFFAAQAAFDDLAVRLADVRQRAEAFPIVPLTAQETAEVERITAEITTAESALAAMNEERQLAAGTILTLDGSLLAWSTTGEEDRVQHRLEPRATGDHTAPDADEGSEIPRLTGKQLRQVIQAVTGTGRR